LDETLENITVAWLAGLLSTNGYVQPQTKTSRRYRIFSVERNWLEQIQQRLALVGIQSRIDKSSHGSWELCVKEPRKVTGLLKKYGEPWLMLRKWRLVETAYPLAELDLERLVSDPVYFIEALFPVKLFEYQKTVLRAVMKNELVMVLKGRQIGISWVAACLALYWASVHSNHHVLILALYRNQAKRILEYVKQILFMQPALLEQLVEMPYGLTKSEIRFQNGSVIEISGVTRPHGDNVRSKHAHLLIVDEAVLLFDRQLSAIEPITAFTKGKRLYISTAGFTGCYFHRKFESIKLRQPKNQKIFMLPACKLKHGKIVEVLCPEQSVERLKEARRDLGDINFRREYLCEWLGAENQMFPTIFKNPTPEGKQIVPRRQFWAGLDVGEVTNPTVLTLIQGTKELACCIKTWQFSSRYYTTKKRLARAITRVLKPWKIGILKMDKTGIGLGLYERLMDEGAPIEGLSWNKVVKNKLMFNLRDALNAPHLYINANLEQLLYELRGYFAEPIEGSSYFEFKCISTDDYVDSLALAWDAIPEHYIPPPTQIAVRAPSIFGERHPGLYSGSWKRLCNKCKRLILAPTLKCPYCGEEV